MRWVALVGTLLVACARPLPTDVPLGGVRSAAVEPAAPTRAVADGARAEHPAPERPAPAAEQASAAKSSSPAPPPPSEAKAPPPSAPRPSATLGEGYTRSFRMVFDLHVHGEVDGNPMDLDATVTAREELGFRVSRVERGGVAELELRYVEFFYEFDTLGSHERQDQAQHGKTYRVEVRPNELRVVERGGREPAPDTAKEVRRDAQYYLQLRATLEGLNAAGVAPSADAAKALMPSDDGFAIKNQKHTFRRLERTKDGKQTAIVDSSFEIDTKQAQFEISGKLQGTTTMFTEPWRPIGASMTGPVRLRGSSESGDLEGRGTCTLDIQFRP